MANYRDIKGFTIQTVTTDPVQNVGTWSSGGDINVVRRSAGTFGTQTASVMVGGESPPVGYIKTTITYDGSSWTLGNDSSRPGGFVSTGAGILTAGWIAGGYTNAPPAGNQANTEHFNGSTWSEQADLNAARVDGNTVGTPTAGLFSGGGDPNTADSEEWNGASWTEGSEMNTARKRSSGMNVGTQTAAACIGGDLGPAQTDKVENYNGASWTEVTALTTATQMGGAFGTTTAFAAAGGGYPATTTTQVWDGVSFSTGNSMAQARSYQPASGNSNTSGLYGGGAHPGSSANILTTEEWSYPSGPSFVIEGQMWYNSDSGALKGFGASVPGGAWASGTSSPSGNNAGTSSKNGTQNAMMYAGGTSKECDQYNGTTWTEVAEFNSTSDAYRGGAGTSTAAILGGGEPSTTDAETFNGTSWTEVNELNLARYQLGAFGTQTAAIVVGGRAGTDAGDGETESFNGTSWTEEDDLQNPRRTYNCGVGVQTAGLMAGGGESNKSDVEEYNGTSWTEIADITTARMAAAMAGSQGSAIIFGGPNGPPYVAITEAWNGTAWTEVGDLSTGRGYSAGGGTTVAGLCMAGSDNSGATAVTEEWNASNTTLTITTS